MKLLERQNQNRQVRGRLLAWQREELHEPTPEWHWWKLFQNQPFKVSGMTSREYSKWRNIYLRKPTKTSALDGFDLIHRWGAVTLGLSLSFGCFPCLWYVHLCLHKGSWNFIYGKMSKRMRPVFVTYRAKAVVTGWLVCPTGTFSLMPSHCTHTLLLVVWLSTLAIATWFDTCHLSQVEPLILFALNFQVLK